MPRHSREWSQRREEATMRAYIRTGSIKEAAEQMGIAETTARQRLMAFYRRLGLRNAVQAAYHLGRLDP